MQADPLPSEGSGFRTSRSRTTDDRGVFRLFGLAAGRYRVCAEPDTGFDEQSVEAFVRTCYPGTFTEENSPPVSVTSGESAELEIRLLRTRVFTVSGTVLDVSGAPATGVTASLNRIQKNGGSGRSLQLDGAGRFAIRGLAPGEYAIHAQIGGLMSDDRPLERRVAYLPFTLASDIEGLVIALSKPAKVAGRVTLEDGAAQRPPSLRIGVDHAPPMYGRPGASRWSTEVRDDLTFELNNLYGQQVLSVEGLPRGWVVESTRYRNEDITGLSVEFKSSSDPQDLQIVLTARAARAVARVVDEAGKPSRGRVMMFPVDPRQWLAVIGVVHHGILQKDGTYAVGPVRAGEYFIVAPAPEEFIYTPDRSRLEALAKVAERLTLGENEERQIELRVVRIP